MWGGGGREIVGKKEMVRGKRGGEGGRGGGRRHVVREGGEGGDGGR